MDDVQATAGNLHRRAILFKLSVMLLALCAFLHVGVAQAYADDIGSITVDGATRNYSQLKDLSETLEGYEGKTLTVDMLTDWDASWGHTEFDYRLVIPKNSNVTFNMHGHIFNRNNVNEDDDYSSDGEVIYIYPGATLTINGATDDEEKQSVHEGVRIFTDVNQEIAGHTTTITGACIAGGNSTGGTGGIYIDSGKDCILNDVTIAGCKAENSSNPFVSHHDDGGGVLITESGTKLKLNNSTITGCLASGDGGGVMMPNDSDENVSIELDNGHIDSNYANDSGGGVNLDGTNVSISGKNGSTISNNICLNWGGGILFWNDDARLSGITMDGNKTNEKGGAVYLRNETYTLKDLTITNNKAAYRGGGIYVGNDIVTIENCTITGNDKQGVYVEDYCDVDMLIKGATVIKDNNHGNLTLQDGTSLIDFEENDNLDIHIGYVDTPDGYDGYVITANVLKDISNHFTADDNGYTVVYSYRDKDQDDGRRLRYVWWSSEGDEWGHHRVNPDVQTVATQDIHGYSIAKTVYAGGYTAAEGGSGTTYQLRSIYAHRTSSGDRDYQTYYTDGFFFDDPIIYNDHLATASYGLATTGAYLDGYDYDYKHAGARQYMADIGCPDQMIYVNDCNTQKPGTDTIGVTIASKVLQELDGSGLKDTDYTLIAIAVRGANYENEWASNVTLGDGSTHDGEAQGFSEAADQVMQAIDYYINRYGLQEKIKNGKVKFWVSGFSRAGATSNLTSKRLIEKYCVDTGDTSVTVATGNQVFAYPCEAPKGGTDVAEKLSDKTAYYCIHNLVNSGDVVPYVGPVQMGFKRYGIDHYLPGTHIGKKTRDEYLNAVKTVTATADRASSESGITQSTNYVDNVNLFTKKDMEGGRPDRYVQYETRRDNMVKHLARIKSSMLFSDYFYPYTDKFSSPWYKKLGDFDGAKVEDYLPNFVAFLQQEACYNRDNYATIPVHVDQDYDTIQDFARTYFTGGGATKKRMDALKNALRAVKDNIGEIGWDQIATLGSYYILNTDNKVKQINFFWDIAEKAGAFDNLTAEDVKVLKTYWFTVMDTFFNWLDGDWDLGNSETPGQGDPVYPAGTRWVNGDVGGGTLGDNLIYTLTLALNVDMIIDQNHDMGVAVAWTRTYDSYYSNPETGEPNEDKTYYEYKAHWVTDDYNPDNYSVDAPGAYVKKVFKNAPEGNETATTENGTSNAAGNSGSNASEPYRSLEKTSEGGNPQYNEVSLGQPILLEVGKIHDDVSPANVAQGQDGDFFGEAIYYSVFDITAGEDKPKELVKEQLYRGGVDLTLQAAANSEPDATGSSNNQSGEPLEGQSVQHAGTGGSQGLSLMAGQIAGDGQGNSGEDADNLLEASEGGVYKIVAHARSLGKESEKSIYYIVLGHLVTVDNGSGSKPLVYSYSSGDSVAIYAMPADDKYFKNWTVKLLDRNGNTVAEDIAASIFEGAEKVTYTALTFKMPEVGAEYETGKAYPDGYRLAIAAVCGNRIKEITPSSRQGDNQLVPVAGTTENPNLLAVSAALKFNNGETIWTPNNPYTISWTYQYNGKTYAATGGEEIYGQCVYTATIVAKKDTSQAQDTPIIFASKQLKALLEPGMEGNVTSINAVRDDVDGSAIVTIVFKETTGGIQPPTADNKLVLRGIDVSDPETYTTELGECGYVRPNTQITVTAKDWDGYKFVEWVFGDGYDEYLSPVDPADLGSRTIKVQVGDVSTVARDLCVYAKYKPVVTDMAAVVEAPVGGQEMQMAPIDMASKETLMIKLKGKWYVVHPGYINTIEGYGSIAWSPEPLLATDRRTANYLTVYTASLRIVSTEHEGSRYIMVKEVKEDGTTGEYKSLSAEFLYAENLQATMNGKGAGFDKANNTLSFTFPITTYILEKVYRPEDVTGIPYGTSGEGLRPYLPHVKILLEGGKTLTASVDWGDLKEAFGPLDEYALHVWMADGAVRLPFGVLNKKGVDTKVVGKLLVNAAESVKRAIPSVDPGTYLYDQRLTLTSETQGAAIYWTTDPDATNDMKQVQGDPRWHKYQEGQTIEINRADATEDEIGPGGQPTGRKLIRLRAAAFKDGMRPDGVRFYTYVFDSGVPVPKGYDHEYNGAPQIGVHGGAFYTLEAMSEGVAITGNGDAVATDPGTYKVKAKIANGYRWEIIDPKTGEATYTTEDQIVTFTISGNPPAPDPQPPAPTPTPAKKVSGTLMAKMTAKGQKALTISWTKVKNVSGYDIFFSKCNFEDKIYIPKKIKTIKGNKTFKFVKRGLAKNTCYKAKVRAYVYVKGKKTYVRKSQLIHAFTGDCRGGQTNAKKVKVRKAAVSLKKGKTYKIKASVIKVKKDRRLPSGHAPDLRYLSTSKKIATVSGKGKIRARGKGVCKIYVFAANGIWKTVKVRVR